MRVISAAADGWAWVQGGRKGGREGGGEGGEGLVGEFGVCVGGSWRAHDERGG